MAARVAFVTGAASGIGFATARLLLSEGWRVALVDRDGATLEKAAASLDAGRNAITLAVDITDEHAVGEAVARTEAELEGLTGVLNSAGIAADVPALDTKIDLFRRILDVNVTGTFIVAQAAGRVMRRLGGGAIVNVASVSGIRGNKGRSAYGASKGAVLNLTRVLANDLAQYNIRVNSIAPGPIETPMVKAIHTDADRSLWNQYVPMKRYGTPEEIAQASVFLLDNDKSSYITGEVLSVDGGFTGSGISAH